MCGRACQTLRPEDIQARLRTPRDFNNQQGYRPSFNVTATSQQPVIVGQIRVLTTMRWGGIGPDPSFEMINIRQDTLSKNGYYKNLFKKNRCLVTAEGYFEWQRDLKNPSSTPLPYYFYLPLKQTIADETCPDAVEDQEKKTMILMAGIYEVKKNPTTGEPEYRYSVITTESYKEINFVHDRMPIILSDSDSINKYLSNSDNFDEIFPLLSKGNKSLKYHRVATLVNSIKNNSSDIIKPMNEYYSKSGIDRFFTNNDLAIKDDINDDNNPNRVMPKSFFEQQQVPQSPSKLPINNLTISSKKPIKFNIDKQPPIINTNNNNNNNKQDDKFKPKKNTISNYFQKVSENEKESYQKDQFGNIKSKQEEDFDLPSHYKRKSPNTSPIKQNKIIKLQTPTPPIVVKTPIKNITSESNKISPISKVQAPNNGKIIVLTNESFHDDDETESLTIPIENSVDLTDVDFDDDSFVDFNSSFNDSHQSIKISSYNNNNNNNNIKDSSMSDIEFNNHQDPISFNFSNSSTNNNCHNYDDDDEEFEFDNTLDC